MFLYDCVMERLHDPEIGVYTSFGIAAYTASNGRRRRVHFISDVSVDPVQVTQLAELCTREQLEPCQLLDAVEDALAE